MTKAIESLTTNVDGGTLELVRVCKRKINDPEVQDLLKQSPPILGCIRSRDHLILQTKRGNIEDFTWFLNYVACNARLTHYENQAVSVLTFWNDWDDEEYPHILEFNMANYDESVRNAAAKLLYEAVERRRHNISKGGFSGNDE